jgi:hypothetical protein
MGRIHRIVRVEDMLDTRCPLSPAVLGQQQQQQQRAEQATKVSAKPALTLLMRPLTLLMRPLTLLMRPLRLLMRPLHLRLRMKLNF